jgi:hypothetical protein
MRGKYNEEIDKKIIDYLNYKAEEVLVSNDMLFKIKARIRNYETGNTADRKFRFFRVKLIIIVGILSIVMAMPVVADKKNLHWFSKKNNAQCVVNQFPTANEVEKALGFLPKYDETLQYKFKFKSFNVIDKYAQDNAGNIVVNNKEGEFEYIEDENDVNKYLKMTAVKVEKECFDQEVKNIKKSFSYYEYSNSMNIYGTNIVRKDVPNDYVETKDDFNYMKDGNMDLIFGANNIDSYSLKYVCWYQDGIEYTIINKGYNDIELHDMIKMAEYILVS